MTPAPVAYRFVPSNDANACTLHLFAVVPMVVKPFTVVGATNVLPPVASWQIWMIPVCPAARFVAVEDVTLPVNVMVWKLPFEKSNTGVAEKVIVLTPTANALVMVTKSVVGLTEIAEEAAVTSKMLKTPGADDPVPSLTRRQP